MTTRTTPNSVRTAAWAGGSEGLEKTAVGFGFIPLVDCAPLVVAVEKGFFQRHGLEVTLHREASWASIRDKVVVGALDGAQMLAAMPIAATLGLGGMRRATITACALSLNGNGITVANSLYERMLEADPGAMAQNPVSAKALKKVIDADRAAGRDPMVFATVFPFSAQNYELRYWMASAGIDPDEDVHLIVVPPHQMAACLRAGIIDGYCVGEPWNRQAVFEGLGRILISGYEIWNHKPEKVFGVSRHWAEKHPNTHRAAIMALLAAAEWIDDPNNRLELARILYHRGGVDVSSEALLSSLRNPLGIPTNLFFRNAATFPWVSHAMWFLTQMYRWGHCTQSLDIAKTAAAIYRPDLYREAAMAAGLSYPLVDYKSEGSHDRAWMLHEASAPIPMGEDKFFDGRVFDPSDPVGYLAGFDVCHLGVSLDELKSLNEKWGINHG